MNLSGPSIDQVVAEFMVDEAAAVLPAGAVATPGASSTPVRVAAIGTTASRALSSTMLERALAAHRITAVSSHAFGNPPDLVAARRTWDLALVLSPYKRAIIQHVQQASPSAKAVGVVDTLLSIDGALTGFNTNTWAVVAALRRLVPSTGPAAILVLGSGASARSTAVGARRAFPDAQILCSARRQGAAAEIADLADGIPVEAAAISDVDVDVIINSTTWGETADSEREPFSFLLTGLLLPGRAYFDLNNRRSSLAERALDAGCAVMTGTTMQVATHACRAALAAQMGPHMHLTGPYAGNE